MTRKTIVFFTVLICMSAALSIADDKQEKASEKPVIFLNTNSYLGNIGFTNGQSKLAGYLSNEGYECECGNLNFDDIDDDFLEDIDVLWLLSPRTKLLDDGKKALRRFIRGGGGLLVNVWGGSAGGDKSNLDSFIRDYGITFGPGEMVPTEANVLASSPLSGPNKCSKIGTKESGRVSLVVDTKHAEAAAKIKNSNKIFVAVSKSKNLGKGSLVVIGYDALWMNHRIGFLDNKEFALNVFAFLTGGAFDLNVIVSKFKGKNPAAGSEIRVIGKVKNIGKSESEATKMRFLLSDSNTYPIGPAANTVTLKTFDIPVLQPNKKKKIREMVKIPNWITPGEYYLITVVDPNGTSGDGNESNNYKASKNTMTIY